MGRGAPKSAASVDIGLEVDRLFPTYTGDVVVADIVADMHSIIAPGIVLKYGKGIDILKRIENHVYRYVFIYGQRQRRYSSAVNRDFVREEYLYTGVNPTIRIHALACGFCSTIRLCAQEY